MRAREITALRYSTSSPPPAAKVSPRAQAIVVGLSRTAACRRDGRACIGVASVISLQACDFVLQQQLATLQLRDLEIVDRGVGAGFDYCSFQRLMAPFQFRKMRHIKRSPQSDRGTVLQSSALTRLGKASTREPAICHAFGSYGCARLPPRQPVRNLLKCCVFSTVQVD